MVHLCLGAHFSKEATRKRVLQNSPVLVILRNLAVEQDNDVLQPVTQQPLRFFFAFLTSDQLSVLTCVHGERQTRLNVQSELFI